ncbi:MAG: pyridoxal-phosphate dependent enzyme [Haloferacaceae archaeon]
MPARLSCPDCGRTFDDRWRCTCGAPLTFADPPRPEGPPAPGTLDRDRGLWAFDDLLPTAFDPRATLGEGFTPLVDAPTHDARFKLEYVFPTGSFKDRGATTTVARALECGASTLVEDSSGNAGAAVATYAARAGLDARIYVPASVKAGKLRAIERAGATPVRVEGGREAVTDACVDAVEAGEGWYASHAWRPAFLAGTATFAYEVAAADGWSVPDAVVTPLGHGTLFLGAARGFRALHEAGWTDRVPRLYGAQAAGYAPFVAARHGERAAAAAEDGAAAAAEDGAAAVADANDAAEGIHINQPVRRDEVRDALDATGGDVVAIGAERTRAERDRLGRAGFHVEATSAVASAALDAFRERGAIGPDEDVVVALTGSGLKAE